MFRTRKLVQDNHDKPIPFPVIGLGMGERFTSCQWELRSSWLGNTWERLHHFLETDTSSEPYLDLTPETLQLSYYHSLMKKAIHRRKKGWENCREVAPADEHTELCLSCPLNLMLNLRSALCQFESGFLLPVHKSIPNVSGGYMIAPLKRK